MFFSRSFLHFLGEDLSEAYGVTEGEQISFFLGGGGVKPKACVLLSFSAGICTDTAFSMMSSKVD